MRRAIAFLAGLGFALSTVVHIPTFFGIDPSIRWPLLTLLVVPAMLLAMPAVLLLNIAGLQSRQWPFRSGGGEIFTHQDKEEALFHVDRASPARPGYDDAIDEVVRRYRPRPEALVLVALVAYAVVNFIVTMILLKGGTPEQISSEIGYVIALKGKVVARLSDTEYLWARAHLTRMTSSFAMLMFMVAKVGWGLPGWLLSGSRKRSAL